MKNPVWALNAALLLIFFIVVSVNFLLQRSLPPKQSMIPTTVQLPPRQTVSPVDLRRIYENDLFKTYVPSLPTAEEKPALELNPPQSPQMQQIPRLQPPVVKFLEPLKIDLKGIITSSDENNNKAIIADPKSGKELNYAVGDTVEDAEIVRIERNKIIFIRSNGQQEVVFLTQREANKDEMFTPKVPWKDIIHQMSPTAYAINKKLFKERIKNVVQLIEMLDMTSVRDPNGNSIGCVVGSMPGDSIGPIIGLRTGDVVVSVDNMPVATTTQRSQVFQKIKTHSMNAIVPIQLLRNQQPMTITISINGDEVKPIVPVMAAKKVEPKKMDIIKPIFAPAIPPTPGMPQPVERKIFDAPQPVVNQLNQMAKDNMKTYGGHAAQIKRTNLNER